MRRAADYYRLPSNVLLIGRYDAATAHLNFNQGKRRYVSRSFLNLSKVKLVLKYSHVSISKHLIRLQNTRQQLSSKIVVSKPLRTKETTTCPAVSVRLRVRTRLAPPSLTLFLLRPRSSHLVHKMRESLLLLSLTRPRCRF